MRKLISKIDKIGWGKAALWTAGTVAYVGWAAHDIYTRGWQTGLSDATAVALTTALCIWVWRQHWPWEPPSRTQRPSSQKRPLDPV